MIGHTISLRGDTLLRAVPDPLPEPCPDPINRIWLDDIRPAPKGWVLCKTVPEARALLAQGDVVAISLDHDLGEDQETGYDLLCWIEESLAARSSLVDRRPTPRQRLRRRWFSQRTI